MKIDKKRLIIDEIGNQISRDNLQNTTVQQTIKQWLKEEAEDETNYIDTDMLEEDNIDMLTLDGSFNFDKLIKMLYEK